MVGGTVENAVKIHPFDESEIAFVAREALQALRFMHYKNLMHRDIKSSNIMLTEEGGVKLSITS